MTARARALVAFLAMAVLSLACRESTGPIDARLNDDIRLPAGGDRDVSVVAGTWVHPNGTSPRLVLSSAGLFMLQYLISDRTFDFAGRFVRLDSMLVLSFDRSSFAGGWVATGKVRGDTLQIFDDTGASEQVQLWDLTFVRVREP